MMVKSEMVGKKYISQKYGVMIITQYINAHKVEIEFKDTGYRTLSKLVHIQNGNVKDKLKPTVYGVGVIGDEISRIEGKIIKEYALWQGMIRRCYDETWHISTPTYKNCSVSEDFKFYPFFKQWCREQVGFGKEGFTLDKDLLFKGNKIYSKETCVFIPEEINLVLLKCAGLRGDYPIGVSYNKKQRAFSSCISVNGCNKHLGYFSTPKRAFDAYKEAKENLLKSLAEKYKDVIDQRAYDALVNYIVEITD